MEDILFKVLPPLLIFFLGYALKMLKILKKEDGDLLLKLVFYIAAPSLILTSLSTITLDSSFLLLLLIGPLIMLMIFIVASLCLRLMPLNKSQKGVFLLASMIMNTGFLIPFALAIFDKTGVAMFLFFDALAGIFTYTFVYSLAIKHGDGKRDLAFIRQKLLVSPPTWAVLIALLLNFLHLSLPVVLQNTLHLTGNLISPLIMLALGIYFSLHVVKLRSSLLAVALRMIGGLLLGLLFSSLFHLEGTMRDIILFVSAAPVGFNTLTFSSLENLDKEFAASIISLSLLFALLFIPLLIFFLQ